MRNLIALTERRLQFAYAVTHELRTPLTTFRLYSDMLSAGLVPEPARQQYLDTLNLESQRLSSLVESVLEYARLENHRVKLHVTSTDGASLLRVLGGDLARRCEANGVEPVMHNRLPDQKVLQTDVDLVSQISGVLVNNACRHASLAAEPKVLLELAGENGKIHLDIADTGPELTAATPAASSSPSVAGRDADKTARGGVGLGLAAGAKLGQTAGRPTRTRLPASPATPRRPLPPDHPISGGRVVADPGSPKAIAPSPRARQFHQHLYRLLHLLQAGELQRRVELCIPTARFGVGSPNSLRREPSVPPRIAWNFGVNPALPIASAASFTARGSLVRYFAHVAVLLLDLHVDLRPRMTRSNRRRDVLQHLRVVAQFAGLETPQDDPDRHLLHPAFQDVRMKEPVPPGGVLRRQHLPRHPRQEQARQADRIDHPPGRQSGVNVAASDRHHREVRGEGLMVQFADGLAVERVAQAALSFFKSSLLTPVRPPHRR